MYYAATKLQNSDEVARPVRVDALDGSKKEVLS
jgi:hypothetical protein